jgi:hypothetical protein
MKSTLPHFKSTNYISQRPGRKTPTPRKFKSNLSGFLSIDDKPSTELESIIKSSKTMLETNLPEIQSKRSTQKRSSILEMWLDEALDPQDRTDLPSNPPLRVEVDKTGPLRTVQKFNIDKKYLRSQNVSHEVIDKIYNSLYIYTYGISNTFNEVIELTKSGEHMEQRIISNFWKAFIKLLEGCTSFQTTFQVIEEGHLRTIAELKDTFVKREGEWLDSKATLEQEIVKLYKQINEQSALLTKLTTDYNISEATLQLTD